MSYLPCRNPQCKSEGKPHPNCRCYGGAAEGGDINFCSKSRPHVKGCQYFVDGGQVMPTPVPEPTPAAPVDEVDPNKIQWDSAPEPEDVPVDQIQWDTNKYHTEDQMHNAQWEGMARGMFGPLAVGVESGLSKLGIAGLSPEDQAERKKAWPEDAAGYELLGTGLGMGSGIGLVSRIGKIGTASKAVTAAIQTGLLQTSDEISNAMLGLGDPEHPVGMALAHIGGAALTGGILGKAASTVGKYAGKLPDLAWSATDAKAWESLAKTVSSAIGRIGGTIIGGKFGGHDVLGHLIGDHAVSKALNTLIGKPVSAGVRKYVLPTVLKALGNGDVDTGILRTVAHAENVAKGVAATTDAVSKLFLPGIQKAESYYINPDNRNRLEQFMQNGGIDSDVQQQIYKDNEMPAVEGFAHGGAVSAKPKPINPHGDIGTHYPEQNIMLNAARGRISNYLNGLRPQKLQVKLPFDSDHESPTKKRSYNKALDIATNPLSIVHEIKKGTVEPEDVAHINAMYPEVANVLRKKMTQEITNQQIKGEKPSYKIRQGLDLFLGTSLSSETTPFNIQAAQAVFANKQQQQQAPQQGSKPKSNTKAISKSDDSFLTGSQSLVRRSQRS